MLEEIQPDGLALSVARVLAAANETAGAQGVDVANSLINISEESAPPQRVWRIQYGPREFINRRGGDLILLVDERTAQVQRVIRGQ
jgi:hypothetical protein